MRPSRVIRPDNRRATIAADGGVGLDRCHWTEVSNSGIGYIRVLALVVATHTYCATAMLARRIDRRLVSQCYAVAQHVHRAALGAASNDLALPLDIGISRCPEHNPAAFQRGGAGLDQAAVFEGAGKDAHGVALERAQVNGLIAWCLYLHADAFEAAPGQLNLLARRQDGAAVGRLDQSVLAGVNAGANQHHIAAARQNPPVHRYACGRYEVVAKQQPACQCVRVAHAQR